MVAEHRWMGSGAQLGGPNCCVSAGRHWVMVALVDHLCGFTSA